MRRFLQRARELADRDGRFKVHFATAREAFNIALAAANGRGGEPGGYEIVGSVRSYRQIRLSYKRASPPSNGGDAWSLSARVHLMSTMVIRPKACRRLADVRRARLICRLIATRRWSGNV